MTLIEIDLIVIVDTVRADRWDQSKCIVWENIEDPVWGNVRNNVMSHIIGIPGRVMYNNELSKTHLDSIL
jgi:hypothetical protein